MSTDYILVVDDEPDIRELLREILEDEGYQVRTAENAEQARRARRDRRPDLTLLDIWLPDVDGITLLKEWSDSNSLDSPVVIMSGHGTVETAVEATRLGAYDFIEKPLSTAKLLLTIKRALETASLRQENIGLRQQAPQAFTHPIGDDPAIQQLRQQIRRVAAHDTPALISGESGSGKEIFAHELHNQSPRAGNPFVYVGVASLAKENPALELFGSEEDGHIHYGFLDRANGGTLFLKDIADLDLSIQARLLGAIQNQSFLRVGGREPVQVDIRVIGATRHDLPQEVSTGRFRDDLYYQLNIVPLTVPALREHADDVPMLLNYYIDYFVEYESLPRRSFTRASLNRLRTYDWPGNVRELKNLVQRLLILGNTEEIDVHEVDTTLGLLPEPVPKEVIPGFDRPLREARELFEKAYLEYQLEVSGGSVRKVAEQAGIERTHLYRKLRNLGIDPKQKYGLDH